LLMKWLSFIKQKKVSETSKVRDSLARFCVGDGLDIGYGGDSILPTAICIDLPNRYARYKETPQHLHGDARKLIWFNNNCLDYVYSSHVLEDFDDTRAAIDEWLRVLKPGGRLVLYLPDEQLYQKHCRRQGKIPSTHHVHENFSLDYIKDLIKDRSDLEIEHEMFPVGIYSFELVLRKKQ